MIDLRRIPQTPYPLPIVLEASWVNGLGIMRGLAKHGLQSLALDHKPTPVGFASRHSTGLTCPDPAQAPDDFGEFLLALGRALPQKGVLLITHDTYLAAIAQREKALAPYFHFTAPSWRVLQRVMDKKIQYETALAQGIAVPRSFFLDDTPPHQIDPAALTWPAILKARAGKSLSRAVGRQVIIVNSLDEVKLGYQAFGHLSLILQEIIPGDDDQLYTFGSCMARSGELLASFTGRKLRQRPAGFGTALAAESLALPELAEQGSRLLRALEFFGPSQVEFKRDPTDGRFKLMEINARFWKWHSLATACGANVAYATYCDATGWPFAPQLAREVHKVWLVSAYDLISTTRRIRRGSYSWRRWRQTTKFPWIDGLFSWRDPLPALQFVWNVLRLGLSHLRRRRKAAGQGRRLLALGSTVGITEAIARAEAAQADRGSSSTQRSLRQ